MDHSEPSDNYRVNKDDENVQSFLLIDENELLQIDSTEEFAQKLGCLPTSPVKVASIFGTIGHGKSYTLNNTFFDNRSVFQTSSSQESCTIGVWAAYDSKRQVITLDTEGLLGVSANCHRRTRLLLKVIAISDIVIYRTKSERLEDNLFTFLGDASRVYMQHFFKELKNASLRLPELNEQTLSDLGPVVIIFQETRDTEPLKQDANQSKESIIRKRFKTLGLTTEAFSAIEYVGIQTLVRPTNFESLKQCIKRHIKSSSARTSRPISVVHATLKLLNEKFNGDIEQTVPTMFNNTLLTCPVKCLSCNARCINSMNHLRDGIGHHCEHKCAYQHQFNNQLLYCRACHERGEEVIVTSKTCSSSDSSWMGLAKYAWAGHVLECSRCGVINRSRQYWFGNKETWEMSIRTEIKHVWPGELNKMQAAQNAAQRVLDSVSYLTGTVSSISAKPTKLVSEWVADQIAPNYWIPNSRILYCALCSNEFGQFDQKHHCRLCGNGLCNTCSSKSKPVPERGWGDTSVRVCDRCYERSNHLSTAMDLLPPLSSPTSSIQQLNQQKNRQSNDNGKQMHFEQIDDIQLDGDLIDVDGEIEDESIAAPVVNPKKSGKQNGKSANTKVNNNNKNNKKITNDNSNFAKANSSSKSIPIPKNRNNGGCSSNTTPTQQSSSSAESSSSSGNSNDIDTHKQINGRNNNEYGGMIESNSLSRFKDNDTFADAAMSTSPTLDSYTSLASHYMNGEASSMVTARKFGEVLQSTLKSVVSTAIDYPLGVIKDTARPEYWTPDSDIAYCSSCRTNFTDIVTIHHCRRCGGGFCNDCSSKSMKVPERGWGDIPVRVCDKCYVSP